jgi:hypothetical protein
MAFKPTIGNSKILVLAVVFTFLSVSVFAYDGAVVGGYDGNFTRYNFIQQASNINVARSVISGFGNTVQIEKLFSIGEDDVDEEDVEMITNQEAFILGNFHVNNGDAFSYAVKRGDLANGFDGWVVFSHYSSSQGWLHYIYYFSLSV